MLTNLRIKNLALVEDLSLELQPGYNAITGETGAGKSVLIGALDLLLGQRADRSLIRSGADNCAVEAIFDLKRSLQSIRLFLTENGLEPCDGNHLLLKRSLSVSGANRQFINGSPTTLAVLTQLGDLLVDIHGPHEHQSLLRPAAQLDILDAFGDLMPLRQAYSSLVDEFRELQSQKASLITDEHTYQQQLDLLRHQVHEISLAQLLPDEEDQLKIDFHRANDSSQILNIAQSALHTLDGAEGSLRDQAGSVGRLLHELETLDGQTAGFLSMHEQVISLLGELQHEITDYAERIELDPDRLKEMEDRLVVIQALKRKYGATLPAVIEYGREAAEKLRQLEQRDSELQRLQEGLAKLKNRINETGQKLSQSRNQVAPRLSQQIIRQLSDLGFGQSRFEISLSPPPKHADPSVFSRSGFDGIEFLFVPNPGEPPKPLRNIASSGELARVMLALKTVLANQDQVPVMVFDEVDANVGGETARAVGKKMQQIGERHQVLCITHLAPVAAKASTHYLVTKQSAGQRTVTHVERLPLHKRVDELARMLGGKTEAATQHAKAMLAEAESDQTGNSG